MTIRLEHFNTQRNLHSHSIPSHVFDDHNEVSCHKFGEKGDANDLFRIELSPKYRNICSERVDFKTGCLRLIHISTNCALHSHASKYTFHAKQQEVTCSPNRDHNDFWVIQETNLPSTWEPSKLGVPDSGDEQEPRDGKSIPFDVLLCKCQGTSVLAVKCDAEKHPLARKAAMLTSEVLHPGKLHKIVDGYFASNLHQDVRRVQGGPHDGQLAIGVGSNKSRRERGVMLAHIVKALLRSRTVPASLESDDALKELLSLARLKEPAPHASEHHDNAEMHGCELGSVAPPEIEATIQEVPSGPNRHQEDGIHLPRRTS